MKTEDKRIKELHQELDTVLNSVAESLTAFGEGARVISTFTVQMLIVEYFIKGMEYGREQPKRPQGAVRTAIQSMEDKCITMKS